MYIMSINRYFECDITMCSISFCLGISISRKNVKIKNLVKKMNEIKDLFDQSQKIWSYGKVNEIKDKFFYQSRAVSLF